MRLRILPTAICALVLAVPFIAAGTEPMQNRTRQSAYMPMCQAGLTAKVNVEQARMMTPESRVVVRGAINQRIGQDLYVFEDDSSSILVTIPDGVFGGNRFCKGKLVELHGELTKSPTAIKIRVAKVVEID